MVRKFYIEQVSQAFKTFPIVALVGPRQVGKTTLARLFIQNQEAHFIDLEDPEHMNRLQDAKLYLSQLRGVVVIDEIQRLTSLFPLLRVLADRPDKPAQFLILGSASPQLLQNSSETLAGRIKFIEVAPFTLTREDTEESKLWTQGGFPRAYLAENEEAHTDWLEQFLRTFLERDLSRMGFNFPPHTMRRFWMMLTHYHGGIINYSELGKSLELSNSTIKRYVDALESTYMIRTLAPWFENISKRQVKQKKIYIRDSGVLHRLLGIDRSVALLNHPKLGSSWEGFVLEQIIAKFNARAEEVFFWAVHQQLEIDLLIIKDGKRIGFEIKHNSKPTLPKQIGYIRSELKLNEVFVVHRGEHSFKLNADTHALTLRDIMKLNI